MSGIPKPNRAVTTDGTHVCSLPFGQKNQPVYNLQSICPVISEEYPERLMMIVQCEISDGKSLLFERLEVSSQVDSLVFQSEFTSDLVTMGYNGMGGKV